MQLAAYFHLSFFCSFMSDLVSNFFIVLMVLSSWTMWLSMALSATVRDLGKKEKGLCSESGADFFKSSCSIGLIRSILARYLLNTISNWKWKIIIVFSLVFINVYLKLNRCLKKNCAILKYKIELKVKKNKVKILTGPKKKDKKRDLIELNPDI